MAYSSMLSTKMWNCSAVWDSAEAVDLLSPIGCERNFEWIRRGGLIWFPLLHPNFAGRSHAAQRLFLGDRLAGVRCLACFTAGVLESARARARSASSVRSRRSGVIDTQLCSIAQRSVPFAAPSNGVTVNQKIERPMGSLSGTTLPS